MNSEPTHFYKNLKTGKVFLFYFVSTEIKWIWNLVTVEGEHIGEWDKKSRLFHMKHGLSNYSIIKLKKKETK